MRQRGARGVERGQDVERIHALPARAVAVGDRLEGEAAGDVDQRVEPAEMRRRGLDRLFRLRGIREIDAAELDPLRRRCCLRWRMVDAGDARAALDRGVRDDPAQRAQRAGDGDDFSVHEILRGRQVRTLSSMEMICNARRSRRNEGMQRPDCRDIHMVDTSVWRSASGPLPFKYPLPHLARALTRTRAGSSRSVHRRRRAGCESCRIRLGSS